MTEQEWCKLDLCICTYGRPESLGLLMQDLATQTVLPGRVIVVDGDPSSQAVRGVLLDCARTAPFEIPYIPSNHASLPYQRYLGWRAFSRAQRERRVSPEQSETVSGNTLLCAGFSQAQRESRAAPEQSEISGSTPLCACSSPAQRETRAAPEQSEISGSTPLCACSSPAGVLVYLDDDLRLSDRHFLAKLTEPLFAAGGKAAAVTGTFATGPERLDDARALFSDRGPRLWNTVFHMRGARPGEMSSTGARDLSEYSASGYERVGWLAGGAMAIRAAALDESCFPEAAFDAYLARRGYSEDRILAVRVARAGQILLSLGAVAQHPASAPSLFGSKPAYEIGFSMGYSRCLLNACHGGRDGASLYNRSLLLWSTLGTVLLNLYRAASKRDMRYWDYVRGFLRGSLRGFLQSPFHGTFAPGIRWREAAARALAAAEMITGHAAALQSGRF